MIVTHALQSSDTLLFSENASMHRRIWKPNYDAKSNNDGEATQEKVDDLIRSKGMTVVEGDAICDEATEYLSQT